VGRKKKEGKTFRQGREEPPFLKETIKRKRKRGRLRPREKIEAWLQKPRGDPRLEMPRQEKEKPGTTRS